MPQQSNTNCVLTLPLDEQIVADLRSWETETGLSLPYRPALIVFFERCGSIVDLVTRHIQAEVDRHE